MKKIIILSSLLLFVLTFSSSAQQFIARLTTTGNQPITKVDFELKLGQNTVQVPTGTVIFTIDGADRVANVKFLDSLGRSFDLRAGAASTSADFKPECSGDNLQGGCFATTNKSVVFCICKPTGHSGTGIINYNTMRKSGQSN